MSRRLLPKRVYNLKARLVTIYGLKRINFVGSFSVTFLSQLKILITQFDSQSHTLFSICVYDCLFNLTIFRQIESER